MRSCFLPSRRSHDAEIKVTATATATAFRATSTSQPAEGGPGSGCRDQGQGQISVGRRLRCNSHRSGPGRNSERFYQQLGIKQAFERKYRREVGGSEGSGGSCRGSKALPSCYCLELCGGHECDAANVPLAWPPLFHALVLWPDRDPTESSGSHLHSFLRPCLFLRRHRVILRRCSNFDWSKVSLTNRRESEKKRQIELAFERELRRFSIKRSCSRTLQWLSAPCLAACPRLKRGSRRGHNIKISTPTPSLPAPLDMGPAPQGPRPTKILKAIDC